MAEGIMFDRTGVPARQRALLFCSVVVIRWAFSAQRATPSLSPDEFSNLGMARLLSGGRWTNFAVNRFQPGLSLLLAPLFTIVSDPTWQYRAALATGGILGGVGALLLLGVLQRLTSLTHPLGLIVAGGLALSPASLTASGHAWAEPLVTVLFLSVLLLSFRFFDHPRLVTAGGVVVLAGLGYLVHGRLLPLSLVAGVLFSGWYLLRRRWAAGLVLAGLSVAMILAVQTVADWIFDAAWVFAGDGNTHAAVLRRLTRPDEVLDAALGQIWYLLSASLLLFGFGVAELLRTATGRGPVESFRVRDARLLLLFTLPLVMTSMVFMSARSRPDHLVYGRYNDAVVWPILALGVAWLICRWDVETTRYRFWVVGVSFALLIEGGVFLEVFHGPQFASGGTIMEMVAGIDLYVAGTDIQPVRVTVLTGLVAAVVIVVRALIDARATSRAVVTVVRCAPVVFIAAAGVALHQERGKGEGYAEARAFTKYVGEELADVETIGVAMVPEQVLPAVGTHLQFSMAMAYEWFTPSVAFEFDRGLRDDVGPYVFAPTNDVPLALNGGVVWADPIYDIALWVEPSEDELGPVGSELAGLEAALTGLP
jgi:hypothetical protein